MNNQGTVRAENALRFVVLILIPSGVLLRQSFLNDLLSPAQLVFSGRNLRTLMEKLSMMVRDYLLTCMPSLTMLMMIARMNVASICHSPCGKFRLGQTVCRSQVLGSILGACLRMSNYLRV